ncbi:MAG: hypothetical protein IPH32_14870 [Bacteroidetes bacterium]|nr:hypothetical protein [Bacteroidota bacterium]
MKTSLLLAFFSLSSISFSQEKEEVQTIKVKKEKLFAKAAFDDTEYKVIAFDRYGNPHEQAIKSFTIFYKEDNVARQASVQETHFLKKPLTF